MTQAAPLAENGLVVGVELRGFEPLTPSMRTRCATGLRHSPSVRQPTCRPRRHRRRVALLPGPAASLRVAEGRKVPSAASESAGGGPARLVLVDVGEAEV